MTKRWILVAVLTVALCMICFALLPAKAEAAEIASGTCGNNLTWVLTDDGVLTISGTGAMANYSEGGSPWHAKRTKITSVVIEDGVTSIGNHAFYACLKMTDISIADSVASIGQYAFRDCTKLTGAVLPEGITSISASVFYNCISLVSVTIPDGITSISSSVFYNCSSLTSITIPDGVTSIGKSAFCGCSSLTSITIPDGVTSIGEFAFSSCSSLSSIAIPDGLSIIEEHTFYGCSNLSSITIPKSVKQIEDFAFSNCPNLKNVYITDIAAWCKIKCPRNPFYGAEFYLDNVLLTDLTIPDDIKQIPNGTFAGFSSLRTVTIPSHVTVIGRIDGSDSTEGAFENCNNLTTVTIGDGVTTIGYSAFSGCSSLTNITIPDGVTEIGAHCFRNCSSLESINIPDSVTFLGYGAFRDCTSLTAISIPDSITMIKSDTFMGCSSLVSVAIPDSVTGIFARAFRDCTSLTHITIPDSVTIIDGNSYSYSEGLDGYLYGGGAFQNCSSLTSIVIGKGVTEVGEKAFSGCYALWHVLYTGTVEEWDAISVFSDNDRLLSATLHCNYIGEEIDIVNKVCSICRANCTHKWDNGTVIAEATCIGEGEMVYTCTLCKITQTEIIAKSSSHAYSNWNAVDGDTHKRTCSVCDKEETASHGWNSGKLTAPTCTEQGYTTYTCENCDESFVDDYVATIEHQYGEWTQVKAPTTEEVGLEERVCTCGDKEQRELPKLDPAPTEPQPTNPQPGETQPTTPEQNPPDATGDPAKDPQGNSGTTVIIVAVVAALGGIGIGGAAVLIVLKRKK